MIVPPLTTLVGAIVRPVHDAVTGLDTAVTWNDFEIPPFGPSSSKMTSSYVPGLLNVIPF